MEENTFADRFKEAVKCAGVKDTQEALAKLFGVSTVTIWAWRNGTKLPQMRTAMLIARTLGVSTEWLLDGTGRGPKEEQPDELREKSAHYNDNPLNGLPISVRELVRLIAEETKAGNLGEEHIELLKNNIKLMTAGK